MRILESSLALSRIILPLLRRIPTAKCCAFIFRDVFWQTADVHLHWLQCTLSSPSDTLKNQGLRSWILLPKVSTRGRCAAAMQRHQKRPSSTSLPVPLFVYGTLPVAWCCREGAFKRLSPVPFAGTQALPESQVQRKYNSAMFSLFTEVWCQLPICTVVDNWAMVIHGGLFRAPDVRLSDLECLPRAECNAMDTSFQMRLLTDALWSDPHDGLGVSEQGRVQGLIAFGADVTNEFLQLNGLQVLP